MIALFQPKINNYNELKLTRVLISIGLFLLISLKGLAQPSETTYLGNVIKTGYINDASYGPLNIGFSFTYFGNTYSQFYVTSNGLVMFGSGSVLPSEVIIPSAGVPDNFIAPFWDDLVIDPSGNILYTTIGAAPNRKLIIQFRNMGFYYGPVYLGTFSVILHETSNKIQTQYRVIILPSSTLAHGASATIGIENSDGSAGVPYSYHNPAAITSGQAISYIPSGLTYTMDPDAMYDGIYLTTNLTLPEPGITNLLSPTEDAIIGSDHTFQWAASSGASSYTLKISTNPNLSGATNYNTGSNLSYDVTGLTLDTTYYWGVFATNATGTTWCEIRRFTTSSIPPLAPVPQTVWVEQGQDKTIQLNYTGGSLLPKTAIITSLPVHGQLYQYNAGVRGSPISSINTTVTDAGRRVIYAATGNSGNGAGNFNYFIHDSGEDSPPALITVNVSPPGVPNVLYVAKDINVQIQFDVPMSDPAYKEDQFSVLVNGLDATINAVTLKEGDPNTFELILATPLSGSETVLVSYTQGDITGTTGGILFSFADEPVTLLSQTINFSQSLDRKYNESPLALTASSNRGLALTYSSSNFAVATITGSVAIFHSLGSSVITARQAGNATYAPAKYLKTLTVDEGDQTITFPALPVKTIGDADFSPGATASSGLAVSYSSGNTSVATIVGGMIHIVGAGTSVITASQAGNAYYNAATPVLRTLSVSNPAAKTLSLTSVMLQGLYNGGGIMNQAYDESGMPHWPAGVADHITVELHSSSGYALVHTIPDVPLSTTGIATVSVPSGYNGSYYITVRHRNSLQTVSSTVKSFAGSNISQSFGTPADVFGGNLVRMADLTYTIYSGDVNQDDIIDLGDASPVDNKSALASSGYISEDVNGDGLVDLSDAAIIDNNAAMAIGSVTP
jgi:hypothetical protein